MGTYAAKTEVSSTESRSEIERTLSRYGADSFMSGYSKDTATIAFDCQGRRVRFTVALPNRKDREFTHTPGRNQLRAPAAQEKEYEQAVRQRWRALALVIKANLEAVDAGIVTFEQAFLPYIELPAGGTVFEHAQPALVAAYAGQPMPELLGPAGGHP